MIALYLDENIPPLIAKLLQAEEYDVISAHEVGMLGQDDEEQLRRHGEFISLFAGVPISCGTEE